MVWAILAPGGTMGTPLVSIVLPVHNRIRFLPDALESILAQSYPHWELLVIDDASGEVVAGTVRRWKDTRIRLYRLPNRQLGSGARNFGMARARGGYLAFLDSDDALTPNSLQVRLEAAQRNPGQAVFGRIQKIMDEKGEPIQHVWQWDFYRSCYRFARKVRFIAPEILLARPYCIPQPCGTLLIPTPLARRAGFFRREAWIVEDWDFTCRLGAIRPIRFVDEPVMIYRLHDENTSVRQRGRKWVPTLENIRNSERILSRLKSTVLPSCADKG